MENKEKTDFKSLVYRQVESDTLDYKSPMNWFKLSRHSKAKFVRHCMALANTRGGYLVVGVQEDASGHPSVYQGLTPQEVKSFDPSVVGAFINHHVSPPIDFTIERPEIDGKRYAIFIIEPFKELPHVCSDSIGGELQQGVFYIRTTDASSRPAYRADEIHMLIRRAMRNQREQLGQMLRGILYENRIIKAPDTDAANHFSELRRHLRHFFLQRVHSETQPENQRGARLEFSAQPPTFEEKKFSIKQLRASALAAQPPHGAELLSGYDVRESYDSGNGIRVFSPQKAELWQLTNSGMCFFTKEFPVGEKYIDSSEISRITTLAVGFAANLYSELGYFDEIFTVKLKLTNCENLPIKKPARPPFEAGARAESAALAISVERSAADLLAGRDEHAGKLLSELAERFKS